MKLLRWIALPFQIAGAALALGVLTLLALLFDLEAGDAPGPDGTRAARGTVPALTLAALAGGALLGLAALGSSWRAQVREQGPAPGIPGLEILAPPGSCPPGGSSAAYLERIRNH